MVFGLTGWTTAIAPDEQDRIASLGQQAVAAAIGPAGDLAPSSMPPAEADAGIAKRHEPTHPRGVISADGPPDRDADHVGQDAPPHPAGKPAPEIAIRVGDHGEFQRMVFEWPEPIEHQVTQRAEQVAIDFGRPGKIDFSRVRDRLGPRVLEARAESGEATSRVVLRLAPNARIQPFSLEQDRIVVVDIYGGTAAHTLASVALPSASPEHAAPAASGRAASDVVTDAGDTPLQASGDAVPDVLVRAGDHGEFERLVFEWPEPVEHQVMQRAGQVVVDFDRPGRIDFSRVRDRFGPRVLEARAEGGNAGAGVMLRVLPDVQVRSFSLQDGRVIVIDLAGGSAQQARVQSATLAPDALHELQRALAERDTVIDNLLARVEQLEREVVLSSGDLDHVVAGGVRFAADPPGLAPAARESMMAQAPPSGSVASPAAAGAPSASSEQVPASASQGGGETNTPARPGEVAVDEDEIDRALERTLVQTGVLLLPVGQAEIEPYFSYTRAESEVPAVAFVDGGVPVGAQIKVRRNEFVSGQTVRFGLPFDSQVEFDFPYRLVDESTVMTLNSGQRDETAGVGHGMGDISIGFAKTLLRENGGWWPDLVARATWDTNTGQTTDNDVVLGGGFNELRSSLSVVKRQDPLAFIGGVSYETSFEHDDVEPGDELGFTIGTILAASPATSLRLSLDQRFVDTTKVGGQGINGSDSVMGTATFGASVVLGRGMLLDVAADIGLTDEAPDYAARASLPIRFNLPVY